MGVMDRGVSRRSAMLTFGAGAGAAFLAACGGTTGGSAGGGQGTPAPGGKQAEIHVNFRQGTDAEWQQKLIPQFEARNPNIKVILDVLPGEPEYWAKVQALYTTGQVGDMIWASLGNYKNFADKGLLGTLETVISRDKYDLKDYKPVAIETMKWQGKLYGMPWGAHTGNPAVLYNADALAAEGIKIEDAVKSYDALYDAAVKLTKGSAGNRTQFGFLPSSGQIGMNNHIRAYGGDFYDQKGEKLTLDQPPAQDAIKWQQKMWRDAAPTFGTGFNGDEFFANGRIALYQTGWPGQFVPGDAQIAGKFKWDIARMPAGPKGIVGTQLTINGITMSSITKQPEATWTYIKYMMDPEVQVQIVLNNGGRPAPRDAVLKNPEIVSKLKAPNVYIPLYDTAMGWPEPANHRWPEFDTAVNQVFGPIWTGAVTLEAGMRDVNSKLQEILSKPKA
jgi:multiple sugar transport system substrate-binding protein